jgi:hypothetical protein
VNIRNRNSQGLEVDCKDNAIVADPAAKRGLPLELYHVTCERIGAHRVDRCKDSPPVSDRKTLEAFFGAVAEADDPFHAATDLE